MSARNCPFKITDGLPKKSDDEEHDKEKGGTVPIVIYNKLTVKRSIMYLKSIDNAYEALFSPQIIPRVASETRNE